MVWGGEECSWRGSRTRSTDRSLSPRGGLVSRRKPTRSLSSAMPRLLLSSSPPKASSPNTRATPGTYSLSPFYSISSYHPSFYIFFWDTPHLWSQILLFLAPLLIIFICLEYSILVYIKFAHLMDVYMPTCSDLIGVLFQPHLLGFRIYIYACRSILCIKP